RTCRHAPYRACWASPCRTEWMKTRAGCSRCPYPSRRACPLKSAELSSSNQSADALAANGGDKRARTVDVENDQRQMVLAAQRDRGLIDHLQILEHDVSKGDLLVELRRRITLRIGRVHTVDARRLDDDARLHLNGAEHRRGVRRKVWIPGAGGKNDDA